MSAVQCRHGAEPKTCAKCALVAEFMEKLEQLSPAELRLVERMLLMERNYREARRLRGIQA